jgi:hypothetical protein
MEEGGGTGGLGRFWGSLICQGDVFEGLRLHDRSGDDEQGRKDGRGYQGDDLDGVRLYHAFPEKDKVGTADREPCPGQELRALEARGKDPDDLRSQ